MGGSRGSGRTAPLPEEVRFFGGVYFTEQNGTELNAGLFHGTDKCDNGTINLMQCIRIFNTEWIHIK